uniref:Uncharacterized protein n=1 Tax=Pundamilia nyererei TaxID=303518 RepID=A0A3B4F0P8_9CICH
MMMRIFFACLFLALFTAGSSLSCKWMDHKVRQHNEETLNLLDTMVSWRSLVFPNHLYRQVSISSAEDKLAFTVQILEEVAALFEEDNSSASWEDSTVRNFLNIVNKQAEELHSCLSSLSIGSHSHKKKNSQLYFKRLSDDVLKKKGHSAEPAEPLASSLHTAN